MDFLPNLAFSSSIEAAFLRWLGSVLRKSCMHWCIGVLPEDMSAKMRVVKLCRAGVGQVRGTLAGRVSKNQFGFHFGGIVQSVCLCVRNDPCTRVYGWAPGLGILFLIL